MHLMRFFSPPSWQASSVPRASRKYTLPLTILFFQASTYSACCSSFVLSMWMVELLANSVTPAHPARWVVCAWDLDSPSLNSDKITDNKDIKKWVDNYLGVGEWMMDQSVAVMGSSSWFERRR
ncbi:hypothetical protein EN45_024270 [Penicillium chrysogenum]|uniref:Uncharacterized protein n=1 Tax=Penicillium chrysogenum TaxID=5076 RepID=A0A167X0H5_PENCH|nr:uncharacterized protein N7525_000413 [Penicillium rubens]KAJ5842672.1 hypothetical protein N7525_000413 [Penicillium rubens]KAJ5846755.1 hypothetical protein N7534_010424 [Penicillium rubens]KZN92273.1 hypothetical protein EN45_024270 [Penicillium chrysogenum]